MKIKKPVLAAIIILFIVSGLVLFAANKIQAQDSSNNSDVIKKLDDVLDGQKAILRDLDSMREELKIIKMRITQQQ